MRQLIIGYCPALTVLKPFLGYLITTDLEVPDLWRHALKILRLVDVDTLVIVIVAHLVYRVGAAYRIPCDWL